MRFFNRVPKWSWRLAILIIIIVLILKFVDLTSWNIFNAGNKNPKVDVKASLSSTRSTAEVYFTTKNGYANVCANAKMVETTKPIGSSVICNDSKEAFAISAPLATDGEYFCADSHGSAKQTTRPLNKGETICP
jgi:Tfp pilus assembly protein PilE